MNLFWLFIKFLPIIMFVGAPITLITTYGIAVAKNHTDPLFPYISDTGTQPPESCIFTLCLGCSSFLLCIIVYVKFREVAGLMALKPFIKIKPIWNIVAFCVGITASVGLNVTAAFQELNEFTVHLLGAMIFFFSASIYLIFQTLFTAVINPDGKVIFYTRATVTALNVLSLLTTIVPIHFALEQFKGDNILKWSAEDGGYEFHLVSAFSEWIFVGTLVCYLLTFYWDFKKFDMEAPVITVRLLDKNKQ